MISSVAYLENRLTPKQERKKLIHLSFKINNLQSYQQTFFNIQ